MKLDLKIGMYFRTKSGTINKIDSLTEDKSEFYFDTKPIFSDGECFGYKWGYTKDIIKASDKLIDLIEKDDIVKVRINNMFINYFVVDTFEDNEENEMLGIACYEDSMLNTVSEYRPLNTLEILEVLTHEQFEQMAYKVGE